MDLSQSDLLVLGRLTGDPDLCSLLQRIDADKERQYFQQMRDESQSINPNTNLIIQYGARASERKVGCGLYLNVAQSASRRHAYQPES